MVLLPDELAEQVIVDAWLTDDLRDHRWTLYCSVTRLCRQWRRLMRAIALSDVVLETPDDLMGYAHILSEVQLDDARPHCTRVRATSRFAMFASVVPDCSFLEIRVGPDAKHSNILPRDLPQTSFHSLTHVTIAWSKVAVEPEIARLDIYPLVSVRTLSLLRLSEKSTKEICTSLPVLGLVFPNITTLRLRHPFPLTLVLEHFPHAETIFLDTPPRRTGELGSEGASLVPPGSFKPPTLAMMWAITAAVKQRGSRTLKHLIFLGSTDEPAGWAHIVNACRKEGVKLEHKVTYKA